MIDICETDMFPTTIFQGSIMTRFITMHSFLTMDLDTADGITVLDFTEDGMALYIATIIHLDTIDIHSTLPTMEGFTDITDPILVTTI